MEKKRYDSGLTVQMTAELTSALEEIQMARPPFVLEKMVVNSKHTPEQRYAQTCLELGIAFHNLRIAQAQSELKEIELAEMRSKAKTRSDELNIEIKQVEKEQLDLARIGASREFDCLWNLWQSFPKKFTRDDLNNAQEKEYKERIHIQAQHDLQATGKISQGNLEAMRQLDIYPYPELDFARDVQKRYLEEGKCRVLIGVPTEKKAEEGLPCIEGINIPNGMQYKIFNAWGRPVADNYNDIVQEALKDHVDYIITVEDDNVLKPDTFIHLLEMVRQYPRAACGAYYYKKQEGEKEGVHIELVDGKRQQMKPNRGVVEAYTLSMGASIYPIEMFMEIPYPWFKTTDALSQDSFFSQLAREKGYKLLVDTDYIIGHKCRLTGNIY